MGERGTDRWRLTGKKGYRWKQGWRGTDGLIGGWGKRMQGR